MAGIVTMKKTENNVILQTRGITKRFGGLVAVNKVDLDVMENQVLGLIGPNGSGKTTVLNLITAIHELQPHQICWQGIARTFQNIRILDKQTVEENLLLGKGYGNGGAGVFATVFNTRGYREETAKFKEEIDSVLEFIGLSEDVAKDKTLRL